MRRFATNSAAAVAMAGALALGAIGVVYAVTPGEHSVALSGVDPIEAEPTVTPEPVAPPAPTPTPTETPAPAPPAEPEPQPVVPAPVVPVSPAPAPAPPPAPAPAPATPANPVEVTPEAPHGVSSDDNADEGDGEHDGWNKGGGGWDHDGWGDGDHDGDWGDGDGHHGRH